jgi:hypothetical protein
VPLEEQLYAVEENEVTFLPTASTTYGEAGCKYTPYSCSSNGSAFAAIGCYENGRVLVFCDMNQNSLSFSIVVEGTVFL